MLIRSNSLESSYDPIHAVTNMQDNTIFRNTASAVTAVGEEGSVVLAGTASGPLNIWASTSEDFAAVKLDPDGTEIWRWQVSSLYGGLRDLKSSPYPFGV